MEQRGNKYKWMKRATFLGCFLKNITTGVTWYWGNMSVYTDSYYRATQGPHSGFGTPWVISIFMIGFTAGLVINERTVRLIGRTWTNITSFFLFVSGIFLSYLTLNSAPSAMTGTMGVLAGLGAGINQGQLLYYVLAWSDHHVGFISALVSSSFSGGSILINQFVTLYVNPQNLSPDIKDGNNVYFTQASVIERIPSMFLVFGAIAFCTQLIGCLLIRDNPDKQEHQGDTSDMEMSTYSGSKSLGQLTPIGSKEGESMPIVSSDRREDYSATKGYSSSECNQINLLPSIDCNGSSEAVSNIPTESLVIKENRGCTTNRSQNITETTDDTRDMPVERSYADSYTGLPSTHHESVHVDEACNGRRHSQKNDSSDPDHTHGNSKSTEDLTTWQMLQTMTFYILWFCAIFTEYGYLIMTNFYKTFGQIWIKHDHFLTNVAMVTAAVSTLSEIGWGAVLDRIKVKHCLMLYVSSLALLGSFWFFTPMVSRYLYMLCTITVCSMNAGMYTLFLMGTLKYFGKQNFSLKYGLIFSGSVVLNFCAPPVINLILEYYGWFELFFSVGAVNALALIAAVLLLPAK